MFPKLSHASLLCISLFLAPKALAISSNKRSSSTPHDREVEACDRVLRDMPAPLVSEWCAAHNKKVAKATPITKATPIPITTTSAPLAVLTASATTSPTTSTTTKTAVEVAPTNFFAIPVPTPQPDVVALDSTPTPNTVYIFDTEDLGAPGPTPGPQVPLQIYLTTTTVTKTSTFTKYTHTPTPRSSTKSFRSYLNLRNLVQKAKQRGAGRKRSEFCPEAGRPCRVVQYSEGAVTEACDAFLAEVNKGKNKRGEGSV